MELSFLKINEINKNILISIISKYYKKFDDFEKLCDLFYINRAMSCIPGINGNPIGFFLVSTLKNRAYINSFFILPEYRGNGFGVTTLKTAVKRLSESGFSEIMLDVLTDNCKAINIYEKESFQITNQTINLKSYYTEKTYNDNVRIETGDSMQFQILYNNFKTADKPWFTGKKILINLLEKEFAVMQKFIFQGKTIGYSVNENSKNKLKIFDIAINADYLYLLKSIISEMATGNPVYIRNLYDKSIIKSNLLENSFSIESRLYELVLKL